MNTRPKNILRLAPLFLLTLTLGCANLSLQRPTAAVKGMQVQNITPQGFTMNFDVDLQNPNAIELPLATADYKMGLAGVQLLDGAVKPEGALPAHGSRAVSLPVTLTFDSLLSISSALSKTGADVPYDFDAGLAFANAGSLFGDMRVPLHYSGTLHLRELLKDPAVLLRSPSARALAERVLGSIFH